MSSNLNVITTAFAAYEYSSGAWVEWSWSGSEVYGEVRDRSKDSFTVDGNEITGDEGENVYKMEEYDTDSGEFTGQMVGKPESSLSSWNGPSENSDIERAAQSMTFARDDGRVFSAWNGLTNMSEEDMEVWGDHPCSNAGVDNGEEMRDNTGMLMGQAPDGWNEESYQIANRVVSWARMHMGELEDGARSGGRGTCPSHTAVHMLNRGINPFSEAPSGNPTFTESEIDIDGHFAKHQDEVDSVYSKWEDAVNMTASQLDRWSDHPCSNEASMDPNKVRKRNMMLLETNKSDWGEKEVKAAKRTVSFISRMRGSSPDGDASEGGKGSCPSEWAVSLLNWAYNPFDGMPSGEPNPETENSEPGALTFAARTAVPDKVGIGSNFNEYGVRENFEGDDMVSVDAVYEAMEPGEPEDRNGVRITKDFLRNVADKNYERRVPYMMDHDKSTLSQVGFVKDVWFSESKEKLMVMARAFNVDGSDIHSEVVSRLRHDPPTIPDGSVGLGEDYEYEENDDGEVLFTDGRIKEFSTTPFPGGYDTGGIY